MKSIEIKAPAKINIGLNIVSKRKDGFHNLETFFYPINDLYDILFIERADFFDFQTDCEDLPTDDTNLVVKAVKLLESQFNLQINVKIFLKKNIPMGAGLGGGSSDAAAVLISLNDMLKLYLPFSDLVKLALRLGSDVPFFIKAKPAIGKSRGEELTLTETEINYPILIVNPAIHISTSQAFANIQPKKNLFDYAKIGKLLTDDIHSLRIELINDFEEYVFTKYPEIGNIKKMMYDSGAEISLMSGSGSTVFGIFNSLKKAEELQKMFPENYFSFISGRE